VTPALVRRLDVVGAAVSLLTLALAIVWAFPLLCAFLIGIAVLQYWIARRMHWLPRQDPGVRRRRARLRRRAA